MYGIYSLGGSNELSGAIHFDKSPGIVIPVYKGVNAGFGLSEGNLTKSLLSKSAIFHYTIPPLVIGSILHVSSLIKSFNDTNKKNQSLIRYYALESMDSISPERFLDFEEPDLIKNQVY